MNTTLLDKPATEIRRFTACAHWDVRVLRTGTSDRGNVVAHADLHRQGVCECRIVHDAENADEWLAANALQTKAIDWIDDWERREHSGTTGFQDL